MAENKSIRISSKTGENSVMPKGSTILGKDKNVTVEEIENGYLLIVNTETKYSYKLPDGSVRTDWSYDCKKTYYKDNPLDFSIKDKSLADLIDE